MKTKTLILSIFILIINLFMMASFLKSCSTIPNYPSRKVNVAAPAKNIGDRSKDQKAIANEAKGIAPEVEPEMNDIINLADLNIEDAAIIEDQQKAITDLEKSLKESKEKMIKMETDLKNSHKNTLIKVLSILTGFGIIGVVVGVGMVFFIFYTTRKLSIMGVIVAGCGGAVAGLCILTIMYLKIIAITVGVIVLLIIGVITIILINKNKTQKELDANKKINEELIDTWEEDRSTAKTKHSLETKQMVVNRKFITDKLKG